jgi:PadR family transcriptional regulator
MGHDNLELIKGTLDLLLLKALDGQKRHGHEVMRWIRQVTDETFLLEEGAIYPALHRLEAKGLISASWGVTENNRRAKYYALTSRGRQQLDSETARWERYVSTVGKVLEST